MLRNCSYPNLTVSWAWAARVRPTRPTPARPPDCTAACSSLPTRLVLCRHSENVVWAIPPAEGASYELLVYNNGEPLTSLPAHVQQQRIPNVGREAFCHAQSDAAVPASYYRGLPAQVEGFECHCVCLLSRPTQPDAKDDCKLQPIC